LRGPVSTAPKGTRGESGSVKALADESTASPNIDRRGDLIPHNGHGGIRSARLRQRRRSLFRDAANPYFTARSGNAGNFSRWGMLRLAHYRRRARVKRLSRCGCLAATHLPCLLPTVTTERWRRSPLHPINRMSLLDQTPVMFRAKLGRRFVG